MIEIKINNDMKLNLTTIDEKVFGMLVDTDDEIITSGFPDMDSVVQIVLSSLDKPKDKLYFGEFVSIWDGETSEVVTPCIINLNTREVRISENGNGEGTCLDREVIRFQDFEYPVVQKEEWEPKDENVFWYE